METAGSCASFTIELDDPLRWQTQMATDATPLSSDGLFNNLLKHKLNHLDIIFYYKCTLMYFNGEIFTLRKSRDKKLQYGTSLFLFDSKVRIFFFHMTSMNTW